MLNILKPQRAVILMVQLAEISWTEAEKILKENDVVLLPVGSTEQHGPHNPLGTDYLVAGAFTKSVGDSTFYLQFLLVYPYIIDSSREHYGWNPPC